MRKRDRTRSYTVIQNPKQFPPILIILFKLQVSKLNLENLKTHRKVIR